MTAVIETSGLGKRYRRTWGLRDCSLAIPEGRVVGLVGPNGAGKTTLLHMAVGLLAPTCGTIKVLGERPAAGPAQLARVGFVAQDTLKGPTTRSSYSGPSRTCPAKLRRAAACCLQMARGAEPSLTDRCEAAAVVLRTRERE